MVPTISQYLFLFFISWHEVVGTIYTQAISRAFRYNVSTPRATKITWTRCAILCSQATSCFIFLLDEQGDCYFKTVHMGWFGIETYGPRSSHPIFIAPTKLGPSC